MSTMGMRVHLRREDEDRCAGVDGYLAAVAVWTGVSDKELAGRSCAGWKKCPNARSCHNKTRGRRNEEVSAEEGRDRGSVENIRKEKKTAGERMAGSLNGIRFRTE